MPTATPFTTLGHGNGFPFCLNVYPLIEGAEILNEPTLSQTMSAYWNFHSASWGGASIETTYEPKDLICDPYAGNQGLLDDINIIWNNSPELYESYHVTRIKPYKRDVYLHHGISFYYSYTREDDFSTQEYYHSQTYYVNVNYTSTSGIATVGAPLPDSFPYECVPVYYSSSYYGGQFGLVGHFARESSVTVSNVTISGIPFVKTVRTSWSGEIVDYDGSQGCPTPGVYPALPATTPTLNLYTY